MRTSAHCIMLLLFMLALSAQAQQVPAADSIRVRPDISDTSVQYGTASFYHDKFEGRLMANGEVFRQANLTAASNTLPLNTWARVTNLSNNRSVIVQITDRMHHRNRRLIDLSRTAASQLKFIGKGITRVKVEFLGRQKP